MNQNYNKTVLLSSDMILNHLSHVTLTEQGMGQGNFQKSPSALVML